MKIEETWEDCTIYLVGFFVKQGEKRKLIHKTLIFSSYHSISNVKEFIHEKFKGVTHIDYIDTWNDDALRLKH